MLRPTAGHCHLSTHSTTPPLRVIANEGVYRADQLIDERPADSPPAHLHLYGDDIYIL